jgi:hypothetical protein
MTLEPYNAEKLDRLVLRLIDISAEIRRIGRIAAESPAAPLALHDRKALEWVGQLEQWAAECRSRAELAALMQRGVKNAQNIVQNSEQKMPKRRGR